MHTEHDNQAAAHESARATQHSAEPRGPLADTAPSLSAPQIATLLTEPDIGGRGNAPVRQAAILQMQQTLGNRAVQRFLHGPAALGASMLHAGAALPIQRGKDKPGDEIDYTSAVIVHGVKPLITAQSGRFTKNGSTLSVTASPSPPKPKRKKVGVGSTYNVVCSGATFGAQRVTYQGTISQIDQHPNDEYTRYYFTDVAATK